MLFNSFDFLLFFPLVVLGYFLIPARFKRLWLLAASLYFYGCWNAAYLGLILFSTLVTYCCARGLDAIEQKGGERVKTRKKLCVAASLVINLAILFVFKYYDFFALSLNSLTGTNTVSALGLLLPVGISFYTFQALGYTIDVYRGTIHAEKNILDYALFVTFFPQLVAGPIERAETLLPALKQTHAFDAERVKRGLLTMAWGYFLKLVIADRAAMCVQTVYAADGASGFQYAAATALFAFQIYCDFAGYSTIALGAARVLGIELMQNFRQPYFCASIADFWRHWHISLSGWFRDYLYFPLGGSRCSRARNYFNLMVVFLVSGLWHGASWTFVVWGALHGIYQIIGSLTRPLKAKLYAALRLDPEKGVVLALRRVVNFALVCFAWIFFRAESMGEAVKILRAVFSPSLFELSGTDLLPGLGSADALALALALVVLLAVSLYEKKGASVLDALERRRRPLRWVCYYALILSVVIFGVYGAGYAASSFIYFQF